MFMERFKTILDLALGDGYITRPRSRNGNSNLRMNHSIKQKEYLLLKKEMLEEVGIKSIYREYADKNGFRVCYVLTRKYPEITEVRNLLYVNGVKTISQNLVDILDERSLALLFQDDGGAGLCCAIPSQAA